MDFPKINSLGRPSTSLALTLSIKLLNHHNFSMLKNSAWLRWTLLSVATLVTTTACTQPQNTTQPAANSSPPLVSATISWVGYSGHYVAIKKGFFAQEGLNIKDLSFKSSSEEITALLANKIDIAWLTSGDAVQVAAKDPSLKIVYLVDYSNGADGIIGRNIATPKDAKGKTIARENLLFEKVLLQAYLKQAGLTESDMQVKDLEASAAGTAFASKKVDMAVTFEPFLTKSAKEGGGKVVFSTKDTNLIADVIVVRDKLIQTRKKDLQSYFKAVDKAVKLVNAGDPEALKIAGDTMGDVPVAEVKEQLKAVKIFDLDGNKTIGFNKSNPKSLIGNLDLTAKAAVDFKIVPQAIKVESLYDDSVINSK
jgi:NitT/TauT family transport system substrate-binding protein